MDFSVYNWVGEGGRFRWGGGVQLGGCSGGLFRWEGVQGGCSGGGVQVGGLFRWGDCSGEGCSGRGGGTRVFSETKIKWKKNPFLCDFFFVIKSIIMDSKRIIMHFVLATKWI